MIDRLVEIEQKDLPKLQKYYSSNDSKSFVAYTTITNYMNWFEQEPNMKHVKFFCLNGDFSGGTFALTVSFWDFTENLNENENKHNFRIDGLLMLTQSVNFMKI